MQTHAFQASDGKIHCHRVEYLWIATGRSPTVKLRVDEVIKRINEHLNKFDAHDWERVALADLSYPIIFNDDHGVVDGWHRIAKAAMLGEELIDARYLPAYPKPYVIYDSWADYDKAGV